MDSRCRGVGGPIGLPEFKKQVTYPENCGLAKAMGHAKMSEASISPINEPSTAGSRNSTSDPSRKETSSSEIDRAVGTRRYHKDMNDLGIPAGAEFAYEVGVRALESQSRRVDSLDTKAAVILAVDGVLAGLLFQVAERSNKPHNRWVSR